MEQTLHYLLLNTNSAFHKKVFSKLSGSGLSSGQPKVLDYLKGHNGCTQKDIAVALNIDPATVTSLLFNMEEAKLIERKSLNQNRRSSYVFLTENGETMKDLVSQVFSEIEDISFDGFSDQEKQVFLDMLMKIHKNISNKNQGE